LWNGNRIDYSAEASFTHGKASESTQNFVGLQIKLDSGESEKLKEPITEWQKEFHTGGRIGF